MRQHNNNVNVPLYYGKHQWGVKKRKMKRKNEVFTWCEFFFILSYINESLSARTLTCNESICHVVYSSVLQFMYIYNAGTLMPK